MIDFIMNKMRLSDIIGHWFKASHKDGGDVIREGASLKTGIDDDVVNKVESKIEPKIDALWWVGTHFAFKIYQESFKGGYLNIWYEYGNINDDFLRWHTDGFISGLKLVAIRNCENGEPGSNVIYEIDSNHFASIPNVQHNSGESIIGIQDCDFKCKIKVGYRPSLDNPQDIQVLFEYEI